MDNVAPPQDVRRLIFVAGIHGRTGTSLVKRLLCWHPQVSAVSGGETQIFEALSELWPTLLDDVAYTPSVSATALAAFVQHVRGKLGETPELQRAINELYRNLDVHYMRLPGHPRLPIAPPATHQVLIKAMATFVTESFRAAALDPSRPVLCEKTPSNALYLPRIKLLFPDSRGVVMVRNPVDVAFSHTRRDWGPTDPVQAAKYTAAYFRRWRDARGADSKWIVIRHEDVVSKPIQIINQIIAHVQLDSSSEVTRRTWTEVRPSVDLRTTVPADVLKAMHYHLNEFLEEFGYSES